jgi:hypothetical protein
VKTRTVPAQGRRQKKKKKKKKPTRRAMERCEARVPRDGARRPWRLTDRQLRHIVRRAGRPLRLLRFFVVVVVALVFSLDEAEAVLREAKVLRRARACRRGADRDEQV